jgi:hypothetical protein
VHHTLPVSEVQRTRNFARDPNGVIQDELALARDSCAQGFTWHKRHDLGEGVAYLAGVEDRKNVRVREMARDLDLTPKSLVAHGSRQVLMKDFDRDLPILTDVPRQIHSRHPATPDLAFDLVAGGECFA